MEDLGAFFFLTDTPLAKHLLPDAGQRPGEVAHKLCSHLHSDGAL